MTRSTPDDLKLSLQKQYNLVCFEDLADYHSRHGSIFSLFKKHHQLAFESNQRLVLYSSYPLSQDFLNHIQRAATKIDVSNFFILIVSPFDLTSGLALANRLQGNDSQVIQSLQYELADSKTFSTPGFFTNYSTICPRPFTSISVNPDGNTLPCCKFKGRGGNIRNNTGQEIFDSEYFESVRQRLSNGQQITECQECWDNEKAGVTSLRNHTMNKFGSMLEQHYFDTPAIKDFSISPSNLCNFSCRICDYRASSKIAAEEFKHSTTESQQKVFKHYMVLEKSNTDETAIAPIIDSLNNAEFLHVMGGEPFLWPRLTRLLDQIIDSGDAQHMQLEFNTNASIFPTDLLPRFNKFKSVEILLSIDDVGERFELQRGGKWENIVQNLESFSAINNSTICVKASPTVNIQNVLYLDELVILFEKFKFDIVWWYLSDPNFLSIDQSTAGLKQLVYKKFYNHANSELRSIAQKISQTAPVSGNDFLRYTEKLDQRRNQSFKTAHKELVEAMSS